MLQVYSNQSGAVLRDGDRVTIQYVPEMSVRTTYAILTGGVARSAEGRILVEFEQRKPSKAFRGELKQVWVEANEARPGLRALALRALEEMADL